MILRVLLSVRILIILVYGLSLTVSDLEVRLLVSSFVTRGTVGIYLLSLNLGDYLPDLLPESVVFGVHIINRAEIVVIGNVIPAVLAVIVFKLSPAKGTSFLWHNAQYAPYRKNSSENINNIFFCGVCFRK